MALRVDCGMSAVGCKRSLGRVEYLTVVIKSRINQSRKKPAKFLGCRRRRTEAVGRVRMIA
jgi:hypothetical protein